MTSRGPWLVLGIERTDDVSAIRRAYARALKAIDPDADPDRFNALRDARDAALALARSGGEEAEESDDELDYDWVEHAVMSGDDSRFATAADYPEPAPSAPSQPPAPSSRTDPHRAAIGGHYDALASLLFPDGEHGDAAPTPDEAARMAEHFAALLDDPRLDHLEFRADAEDELARLLAAALPRSDALIPLAVARFGWEDMRGRVDEPPTVRALTDRADTLAYRDAVTRPSHPLYGAWRELTKPATETSRRSFGVSKRKVNELLGTVRTRHPALEHEFDWYRVALWKPSATRRGWRSRWWPYAFAIWIGLRILSFGYDHSNLSNRSPPYGSSSRPQPVAGLPNLDPAISGTALISADVDLGDAVALATDSRVTLSSLAARQPALVRTLRSQWMTAHDGNVDRARFVTSAAQFLRERAFAGQRVAPYPLAAEFASVELAMERALGARAATVDLCGDAMGKRTIPAGMLDDALLARREALVARSLLETNAAVPEPGKRTFLVPGAVITAAAARARLPRAAFAAAMHGDGPVATRCTTRIALLEEALALPHAESLPLLRQL